MRYRKKVRFDPFLPNKSGTLFLKSNPKLIAQSPRCEILRTTLKHTKKGKKIDSSLPLNKVNENEKKILPNL